MSDLTPIERTARQCTIYVSEVYDPSGNEVIGTRALAKIGEAEVECEVGGGRLRRPEDLGALLRNLGHAIAHHAVAATLGACSRWWCRAGEGQPCRSVGGDGRRRGIKAEMHGVLDVPHVFMVCAPDILRSEADRLARAVVARGLLDDAVSIEAVYFPLGCVAVLELFCVDDDMLARAPDAPAA
jgi:hypothetical protein